MMFHADFDLVSYFVCNVLFYLLAADLFGNML